MNEYTVKQPVIEVKEDERVTSNTHLNDYLMGKIQGRAKQIGIEKIFVEPTNATDVLQGAKIILKDWYMAFEKKIIDRSVYSCIMAVMDEYEKRTNG